MKYAKLRGVTLIRNGNLLKYPWKECIQNMLEICDEVWVNCDPLGNDNTWNDLVGMSHINKNLKLFSSNWDMENRDSGTELAKQINLMLPKMPQDGWILYLQADEFVHPNDKESIDMYLKTLPLDVTQIELFRTYFWKDINHRLPKHELWLGRIFRAGTHEVGGDGMWLIRHKGNVARISVDIYHYSRLGDSESITARIRACDSFFHSREVVETFKNFNYNEVRIKELREYVGSHPPGIKEFYDD